MLDDFILDDLGSLDGIDISDLDVDGIPSGGDSSDFYDSFCAAQETISFESGDEDFSFSEPTDEISHAEVDKPENIDSHERYHISFTGNGRCRVCGCRSWAGFGDTCANCGHFYNKHI